MIATLGMYDMPHTRSATDRLWASFHETFGRGPDRLDRDIDPWTAWLSPDLLLAQTCGMPYRTRLHGAVTLVGTPDYGLPDCPPGHYFSYLIKRHDDPRGLAQLAAGTLAYNDPVSQSGWSAPVTHLAAAGLTPSKTLLTGAHLASIMAVIDGKADFAGIDVLTLLLFGDANPDVAAVINAFARTTPTPALPYITAKSQNPHPISAALGTAISGLSKPDRDTLRLHGLIRVPAADYLAVPTPPAP